MTCHPAEQKVQEFAEASAWIVNGHGSERLREIAEGGLLHLMLGPYRAERLAAERPELPWRFAVPGSLDYRSKRDRGLEELLKPRPGELALLATARAASPTANLFFFRRKHRHTGGCSRHFSAATGWWWRCPRDREHRREGQRWDYHGPVLVDTWRGRQIVVYLEVR